MLTVAPRGTTKFAIGVGTTPVFATHWRVTGIVAALDAHANAVVCAGTMCLRYPKGLFLVKNVRRPMSTIQNWAIIAMMVATMSQPTLANAVPMSV
jgi:hypothetical protein